MLKKIAKECAVSQRVSNSPPRESSPTRSAPPSRPSSPSTSKPQSQNRPARSSSDRVQVSRERGRPGATPDFGQSFGNLRQGSKGDSVRHLQESLNAQGARLKVDGKFGKDTSEAVRTFQEKQQIKVDGVAGKDTFSRLQGSSQPQAPAPTPPQPPTPAQAPARPQGQTPAPPQGQPQAPASPQASPQTPSSGPQLQLPGGYESLQKLSGSLAQKDPRFNQATPDGRAATALALAIGGTELYGKGTRGEDFFTRRGGTGNNMLGFAQFNQAYHQSKTNTPEKYTKFLGDILHGRSSMPNGRAGSNHVQALNQAVQSGKIKTGEDLRAFMKQRGFGGSNWQGIDDGWGRNPGLANSLVQYLRQSQ